MISLKQKIFRGIVWNTIENIFVRGSQFFINILLARILSPDDYGLVGMLAIFIALSTIIIESGFVRALIQKKDCSDIDKSTAFVTNLGLSVIIYTILFILAPFVADFYNEPILCDLLRVSSIGLIISSFNIVHRAQIIRNMDFKSLTKVNLGGTLLGGFIGIAMAFSGMGVWSLLGQSLGSTFVLLFLFPIFSKWKPKFQFSKKSFKQLFGFGSNLLIAGIVGTIFDNISSIAIGKIYRSSQLGFYTRAQQFPAIVSTLVSNVTGSVTFPALSELQTDKDRMLFMYKKALFYTATLIFPAMVIMALLARPLVIVLLTEKWLPCVFMLQILCFSRVFTPISAINMNILNAVGRSDLYIKVDLSKLPITAIILVITIPIGVEAMVVGELVCTFICFFINAYYPGKKFGYGAWKQIKDWRYIILSILIMSSVLGIYLHFVTNIWLELFGGAFIAISVYLCSCFAFNVISINDIRSLRK